MPEIATDLSLDEFEIANVLATTGSVPPAPIDRARTLVLVREQVHRRDHAARRNHPRLRQFAWASAVIVAALAIAIPVSLGLRPSARHVDVVPASWAYAYGSVGEIGGAAEIVVVGMVLGITGQQAGSDAVVPQTVFAIQVERALKGVVGSDKIDVLQDGGEVSGGSWVELEDYPLMTAGDHVLLFLNSMEDGSGNWTIPGGPQGRMLVTDGTVLPWPGTPSPVFMEHSLRLDEVATQVRDR